MRLPFETKPATNLGVSILEMLVVLTIVALILSVSALGLRGPSETMTLKNLGAELIEKASKARHQAIAEQSVQELNLDAASPAQSCESDDPVSLVYFPNGSVLGDDICLDGPSMQLRLRVDRLTGLIVMETR